NTLVLAFWSGLAAVMIGAPMAWLTARTDLPGARLIKSLVMASFVTPPFLGAFAWVMLAGPNAGYLNKLYRSLTGAEDPLVNIFTTCGPLLSGPPSTLPRTPPQRPHTRRPPPPPPRRTPRHPPPPPASTWRLR